ncbi:MAG: hypothetical protein Ct9H300mP7_0990 [Verrucomicrobiota bacterium]|nr:MAG: hypothetical protein Ct9H300mP7_0990 [Verrucomicrobiota bacterium]
MFAGRWIASATAHDVGHFEQQGRPMAPLGCRFANSDFLKPRPFKHGHGECVAHDERGGGAGGGGHVEGTGFFRYLDVEYDFRVLAKGGSGALVTATICTANPRMAGSRLMSSSVSPE